MLKLLKYDLIDDMPLKNMALPKTRKRKAESYKNCLKKI